MPRRCEPVPREEGSVPGGNEQMPLPPVPALKGRDRVGRGGPEHKRVPQEPEGRRTLPAKTVPGAGPAWGTVLVFQFSHAALRVLEVNWASVGRLLTRILFLF